MNRHIQLSADILRRVGPTRIAVVGSPDDALITQLWLSGAAAHGFDDVERLLGADTAFDAVLLCEAQIVNHTSGAQTLLARLRPAVTRHLMLLPLQARPHLAQCGPSGSAQHWVEAALRTGYRRSPMAFAVADYAAADDPALPDMLLLEKIDDRLLAVAPAPARAGRAGGDADASRAYTAQADARLARYALAAQWVRAGDTVLDCACGSGEGTALLAAQSVGGRFIGVDPDAASVTYARDHFGHGPAQFHAAEVPALRCLPDASVDIVVAFDTLARMSDAAAVIDEIARVLKPDGRVIASAPQRRCDEDKGHGAALGSRPGDWLGLVASFDERFIVEKRYRQDVPGDRGRLQGARRLQEVPLEAATDDDAVWIVVASVNPLRPRPVAYRHPAFDESRRVGAHVADFGACYDNPWIYRSLVQMGERLTEPAAARALLLDLLGSARQDSADFGAAATVLTYAVMGGSERRDFADDLLSLAEGYFPNASVNPHVRRWQISLGYAAGLLALSVGRRDIAAGWFDRVQARDAVADFSPLLATKTVAAGYWAAMLALSDRRAEPASIYLTRAIAAGSAALRADPTEAIGDPAQPLAFGFQELAEVADMTSQCALALRNLPWFDVAPGRFWRAVDVRRFGLSSWAQAVQRENQQLLQWLNQLQGLLAAQAATGSGRRAA